MSSERAIRLATAPWRAFERLVFVTGDARQLAALRVGLFGLLAINLATASYSEAAERPESLRDPVWFMEAIGWFPDPGPVPALQVIGVAAALCATVGAVPRVSFPLAYGTALLLGGVLMSQGQIHHQDMVLMLALLPIVVVPRDAVAAWSWRAEEPVMRPPSERFGWPVRTAMALIAIAYCVVGTQKLLASGLDWAFSENLSNTILLGGVLDSPNEIGRFVAERPWVYQPMAVGTLVLETCFPVTLIWPRSRWFFVPGVFALHVSIYVLLGIGFMAQAFTVLVVFVSWPVLADWLSARSRARRLPATAPG